VEDASGRRLYVCLRCGNKFWSRAKKPQCSVCRSKRVVPYEEFLKLPVEEREQILGKKREVEKQRPAEVREEQDEKGEKLVKAEENREVEVKREEPQKVTRTPREEKPGEKVKGERVKKLSIPKPRLSWKAWSLVLGVVFIYYLYKVGWFDSILDHLKFMKASSEVGKGEKERPVVRSPVLGRIESNLRG